MNTTQPQPKAGFRLTPRKLLLAAFLLAFFAVAALIVGVFRTLNQAPAADAAPAENTGAATVEIWRPGSNTAVGTAPAGQAVPPLPTNTAAPVAETEAAHSASTQPAVAQPAAVQPAAQPAAPRPRPAAAEAPAARSTPAQEAPAPVPAAKPVAAAQPEAPKEAAPKPAPKPAAKPKEVTDSLF